MHRRRFLAPGELGPKPDVSIPPVSGFMACPVALCPGWMGPAVPWWHEVYRIALERAQAVLRPSRWERWMKPVWN